MKKRDKAFNRRMNLKAFFGITPEQYDQLVADQNGLRAICEQPMRAPKLDHCHATGQIRAMLCHGCNTKLGYVEWVLRGGEFVTRAKAYLQRYADPELQKSAIYSGSKARIRRKNRG